MAEHVAQTVEQAATTGAAARLAAAALLTTTALFTTTALLAATATAVAAAQTEEGIRASGRAEHQGDGKRRKGKTSVHRGTPKTRGGKKGASFFGRRRGKGSEVKGAMPVPPTSDH